MTPLDREALLRAVHPDPLRFTAWAPAQAAAIDWRAVERRAQAHKLAALLAARVAACDLGDRLDPTTRPRLDEARADAAQRAQAAERTLAIIAETFAAAGVPFFVVKGSVIAHAVYGDPHLRRFADVDVVVRRADVASAEAALHGVGYRPGGIEGILGVRPSGEAEHARALALTRGFEARELSAHTWLAPQPELLSVDLHWHVSPWRLRVDEEAIWARTERFVIGPTAVLTLTPPATLIHLVAHATTSLFNGFRLLHLCDVAWAAQRVATHDAETWQLARQWGVAAHLAQVCHLVERTFDVNLPLTAGAPPVRPRPGFATVADPAFLLGATDLAKQPLPARLRAELAWGSAMGCLDRNLTVVADVSLARARFRFGR